MAHVHVGGFARNGIHNARDMCRAGILPHAKGKRRFGLILRLGLALVFGVSRQPHVVGFQGSAAHVQEGAAEPQAGVKQSVHAPAFHRAQHVSCQVGQCGLAQRLLHLVLDVHGHRQLKAPAGEQFLEVGQLLVGLLLVDCLEVAIHAAGDAQPLAFCVVAGKLRVSVGGTGPARCAVAHGANHYAVHLAACLDLLPVDCALMPGHVHDFSHSVLLTA